MVFGIPQIRNVLGINFYLDKSNANLLDQAVEEKPFSSGTLGI